MFRTRSFRITPPSPSHAYEGTRRRSAGARRERPLHNARKKENSVMATRNRGNALAADQKLIDGVQQFLSNLPSLTVGSKSVTPADIIKVLQDRIAKGKAV